MLAISAGQDGQEIPPPRIARVKVMDIFGYVVLALLVATVIYLIVMYNRLVNLKHNATKAWSNIDVLLKQRHDELPKLVSTCREYMKYECYRHTRQAGGTETPITGYATCCLAIDSMPSVTCARCAWPTKRSPAART